MSRYRFFHRRRSDNELQEEIEGFLVEETAANEAKGLQPEEARRQARVKLGSAQKVREKLWDQNSPAVLSSFGPNSIIVFKFPVGIRTNRLSPEERVRKSLTYENAIDIRDRCSACAMVSPMLFPNVWLIIAHYKGNDVYDVNIFGVEEAYGESGQVDIKAGRFFTDDESRRRAPVVVIGEQI